MKSPPMATHKLANSHTQENNYPNSTTPHAVGVIHGASLVATWCMAMAASMHPHPTLLSSHTQETSFFPNPTQPIPLNKPQTSQHKIIQTSLPKKNKTQIIIKIKTLNINLLLLNPMHAMAMAMERLKERREKKGPDLGRIRFEKKRRWRRNGVSVD